ncbi:RHS repeat-associated core domain-containing protein [Chryseobacterium sp. SIMBA_028]|uniref:RHS repeat-associated core domain-containing protein n=1 Tax=Chryseobacterium sp. SIMBA_028 TaxID=3085771 RepID=UPI00397CFB30
MYDYGARMYMPDLGRWGVVDPLAEKYQDLSPFRYSFNNPVNFVDPVGLTEEDPPNKKGIRVTAIEEVVITVKKTNNWVQRNVINPIAGFIRNDEHKRQPQVLPPINTFWSRFYQREWSDQGLTYIVARDGRISHIKPIGGAGPLEYISGAGELKYLLASKEALETFKSTEIAAQSTEKVQKLAKLMREGDISIYGEKIVVYLKEGERYILDGHHRIQAAIQENKTLEVIEVTGQKAMQMFKDKVKQIDSGLFK